LMHKPRVGPLGMPAKKVLEMATLGGARAIGMAHEIGSLEVGKRADITVVDLGGVHTAPGADEVESELVYASRAPDVRHVLVDGRQVVRDGQLLTLDRQKVVTEARRQAERLLARVG